MCSRPHGHRATITVGCGGTPNPEFGSCVIDPDLLLSELRAMSNELSCRDLAEMIAPAKPTAAGLAGWAWERLALNWPTLAFVEATLGDMGARIDA